jgi:hypothetical protein
MHRESSSIKATETTLNPSAGKRLLIAATIGRHHITGCRTAWRFAVV